MLCTLADIKTRLGDLGTEYDAMLTRMIASFAAIADAHTGRTLIAPAAAVTEYYTGCGAYLQLKSYPLVAVTSIKEAFDYDFTNASALVLNTDYRPLDGGLRGVLFRLPYLDWCDYPDAIEVKHRSGYCAAGVTPSTGETALPDDLREAAIEQVSFIFKRRDDIGLSSNSMQGGSINVFSSMDLLPLVKAILDKYRRIAL
jgi:hypothetical protein